MTEYEICPTCGSTCGIGGKPGDGNTRYFVPLDKKLREENSRFLTALKEIRDLDTGERYLTRDGWHYVCKMREIAKKALKGENENV